VQQTVELARKNWVNVTLVGQGRAGAPSVHSFVKAVSWYVADATAAIELKLGLSIRCAFTRIVMHACMLSNVAVNFLNTMARRHIVCSLHHIVWTRRPSLVLQPQLTVTLFARCGACDNPRRRCRFRENVWGASAELTLAEQWRILTGMSSVQCWCGRRIAQTGKDCRYRGNRSKCR